MGRIITAIALIGLAGLLDHIASAPANYSSPNNGSTITPAVIAAAGGMTDRGGGVYAFEGQIRINAGDTFSIPAGTQLVATGNDPSSNLIDVFGHVVAEGTSGSPIVFKHDRGTGGAWGGLALLGETRTIRLKHIEIKNVSLVGLNLSFSACDAALSNISLYDMRRVGIQISNGSGFDSIVVSDVRIDSAATGIRLNNAVRVKLSGVTVTNLVGAPTGYVKTGIWLSRASPGLELSNSSFSGNGLYAGLDPKVVRDPDLDNDSILITDCSFTGSSSDTAIHLRRSIGSVIRNVTVTGYGIGIAAHDVAGLVLDRVTATGCATAIRLDGANGMDTAAVESPASRLRLAFTDADVWGDGVDFVYPPSALGFTASFAGRSFTHYIPHVSGAAELLTQANAPLFVGASRATRARFLEDSPAATFLFGFCTDLSAETGTGKGYGYRLFSPGENDSHGASATETCGLFVWRLFSESDSPSDASLNHVYLQLFPDGRMRWYADSLPYRNYAPAPLMGFSIAGIREGLAAILPRSTTQSLLFSDTGFINAVPTTISNSSLQSNTTGLSARRAIRVLVASTTITGNSTGILVDTGAESVTVSTSNVVSNTSADINNASSTGTVAVTGSYLGGNPLLSGNTGAIVVSAPSSSPIVSGPVSIVSATGQGWQGCLLGRLLGTSPAAEWARQLRDEALASAPGRILVETYYFLFGR